MLEVGSGLMESQFLLLSGESLLFMAMLMADLGSLMSSLDVLPLY